MEPQPKSLENPPSEEEMSAAFDRIFGQGGSDEPDEPAAGTGGPPATPAADEPAGSTTEQAADRPGGKATPAETAEEGEFVTIRGRQVPVSEVEEWEMGHMRQDQFTRETQRLAEERRFWQSQLTELTKQNQQILAMTGRLNRDGTQKEEEEAAEPLDPTVAKALKGIQGKIQEVKERIEERDQQVSQERESAFIRSTFESTLGTLFKKFNIPADDHALYKHAILGMDPVAADESGPVNENTIRRETFRCFSDLYRQRTQHQRQIQRQTVQELRQHAQPPKKPAAKAAAEPEPKTPPAKRKSREPWDTDEAVQDVFDRLHERTGAGEG